MAPLRSYLVLLASRTHSRNNEPVIHYVIEESPQRAIEVSRQSHPDHRVVWIRDVTDQAAAA